MEKKFRNRHFASFASVFVSVLMLLFVSNDPLRAQSLDVKRLKKVTSLADISTNKKYAFVSTTSDGKLYTMTSTMSNNGIVALCLTDSPESFSESSLFQLSYTVKTSKANFTNCATNTKLNHNAKLASNNNSLEIGIAKSSNWSYDFYLNEKTDGISTSNDKDNAGAYVGYCNSSVNIFKIYKTTKDYPIAYLYEYDESNNTIGSITILTDEGYGTYYLDKDFVMPNGLKGATVSSANKESGELNIDWKYTAGSTVPANTALLVYGTKGTTYTLEAPTETATVSARSTEDDVNLLRGSVAEEETSAPEGASADDYYFYQMYYVTKLNEGQKQLGFFWGAEQGGTFTNGANKAYLALPRVSSVSIKGFALPSIDDNVSAITPIKTQEGNAQSPSVYTLSGKRCNGQNLPKGIYIVNGKKTIMGGSLKH